MATYRLVSGTTCNQSSFKYHRPKMFNWNRIPLNLFCICLLFIISTGNKDIDQDDQPSHVNISSTTKNNIIQITSEFNQSKLNSTQTHLHPLSAANKGRGHLRKRRKFLKHLYPFLMAVLFAKLIVVPLVLKLLIATTSSAFVMSKIALVVSGLMALSWLLGATRERAKLQIVQFPGPHGLKKTFGGWNVQEKYSPHPVEGSYNSWNYDDGVVGENNDRASFL